MPTNMRQSNAFADGRKSVLYSENGLRSPRMRTIDLDYLTPDADGNQILEAGTIIASLASGYGRPLGFTEIATAITTASTTITVDNAAPFKAGEVLVVARPYARADVAATWATNDTLATTLDGYTLTTTVTASEDTLTKIATKHAAEINANPFLSSRVEAIAENQYVHYFGKSQEPGTISVAATTAGDGTYALDGSVTRLQVNASVGTLAASDAVNTTTNVLTLSGTAARRLPVDAPIGVVVAPSDIVGMVLTTQLIGSSKNDITPQSNDVACYTSASVYRDRLPYWDDWLQSVLPEITLVP